MKTPAFDPLAAALCAGRKWEGMGDSDRARKLLEDFYLERYGKRLVCAGERVGPGIRV